MYLNENIVVGFLVLICISSGLSSELNSTSSIGDISKNATQPVPGGNKTSGDKSKGNEIFQVTLPFVMKPLGLIECEGANPEVTGQFFEHILGSDVNYNQSDYLCGPTCRGKCVPRPQHIGIPPTFYPFGCHCEARGCGLNGPMVAPLSKPYFKMVCKPDPRCTCYGMGPGQYLGYSCHFVNLLSGLPITFKEKTQVIPSGPGRPPINLPPQFVTRFHPIQWCSCCPRTPRIPKHLD